MEATQAEPVATVLSIGRSNYLPPRPPVPHDKASFPLPASAGHAESSLMSNQTDGISVTINAGAGDCEGSLSPEKEKKEKKKKKKLAENKIHVQNERTFLSWFSAAMFLFFLGFSLMREPHTRPLGICVCLYASGIVIYALWQYQSRMKAFFVNDQTFEYRDKFGPIAVTVGLFVTIIVGLGLDFAIDGTLDWEP